MATSPERLETSGPAGDRTRSPAVLALAVAGLLLLLLIVWFFFLRSPDEPESVATAPTAEAPVDAEEEEEVAPAPSKQDPVETFEVFAPKDPFDPLISQAAAGGGDPGTAGGTVAGADGTTTATPAGDGTTTTTTTTQGGGGSRSDEIGGHRVRVVDVFSGGGGERRAQIQVDGTVYTVNEGERFASNFQLLDTSGACATMLFGDDEFTLCEGEEVLK